MNEKWNGGVFSLGFEC